MATKTEPVNLSKTHLYESVGEERFQRIVRVLPMLRFKIAEGTPDIVLLDGALYDTEGSPFDPAVVGGIEKICEYLERTNSLPGLEAHDQERLVRTLKIKDEPAPPPSPPSGKVRAWELAKHFGKKNKEFLEELKASGIAVKSHLSLVDEETAGRILALFGPAPDGDSQGA